jgi:hypothetical protein
MSREAFEKAYHKETGLYASYAPNEKGYTDVIAGMCYRIWQAALQHSGEPVALERVEALLEIVDDGVSVVIEPDPEGSLVWYDNAVRAMQATPRPVPEGYVLVTINDLKKLQFYLEPYDDIKPRDWVTDRQNLRRAHELIQALLSACKENNNE